MTGPQSRAIWGLAKRLKLGDEALRDLVESVTGQRSLSKLSNTYAGLVIERLKTLAGQQPGPGKQRPGRATPEQLWKQRQLAEELGWDDDRLRGFVRRMTKVDRPEWQPYAGATKVIEGLKAMVKRNQEAGERRGRASRAE